MLDELAYRLRRAFGAMAMLAQLTTVLTVGSLLAVFDRYAISPRQPSPSGDG